MSAVDDILRQIPVEDLAMQVGSDPQTTEAAVRSLVPELIGTMQRNAQDPAGEQALATALSDHAARPLLDGGNLDLNQVDPDDGAKITQHIFGAAPEQAAQQLSGAQQLGGIPSSLIQKLLPLLAPIVLAYLAKQITGGQGGSILGSILGGGNGGMFGQQTQQQQGQQGSGNILSDILGSVLGGGGMGDILGGQQGQAAPQQQSVPTQQGNSPFNDLPVNDQQPTIDGGAPQQQEQAGGGGLMDVLKDVFGGKGDRR